MSAILTPAAGPLYESCDYRTSVCLQDEFISGASGGTGSIGDLGWQFSGGTANLIASESGRFGIIRRDTGSSSGTVAYFTVSGTSSVFDPSLPHVVHWEARLNTNDANTTVRLGPRDGQTTNPPINGIYFEKLDADTNWFCVTRKANTETRTDTGVAINTNWNAFRYVSSGSSVQFFINGTLASVSATNIPTVFIGPSMHIINSTAASKTIDIDYFYFRVDGLTR